MDNDGQDTEDTLGRARAAPCGPYGRGRLTTQDWLQVTQGRSGQRKASARITSHPFLLRPPLEGRARWPGKETPGLSGGRKEKLVLIWRERAYGGFWQWWSEAGGPKGLKGCQWGCPTRAEGLRAGRTCAHGGHSGKGKPTGRAEHNI